MALIVSADDDTDVAELIALCLDGSGQTVHTAADGLLATGAGPVPAAGQELMDPDRMVAVGRLLAEHGPLQVLELGMLAASAARLAAARTATVGLVLTDTVRVTGSYGLPERIEQAGRLPARWAPCASVVRHGRALLVDDLGAEERWNGHPVVAVDGIRSYAGVPLRTDAGHLVGTLAVMDPQPRAFTAKVVRTLAALAPTAAQLLGQATRAAVST